MKMRKLIGVDALLDYHDPVANPAHEPPPPKKGSTGGKGGNNRWVTQSSSYSLCAFVRLMLLRER